MGLEKKLRDGVTRLIIEEEDRAIMETPLFEVSLAVESEGQRKAHLKGPPRQEIPCPTCSGRGTVISYDIETMQAKRKALRLTQSGVARAAGWQASIVSELESGSRPMTEASAERYWKALHEAERRGS